MACPKGYARAGSRTFRAFGVSKSKKWHAGSTLQVPGTRKSPAFDVPDLKNGVLEELCKGRAPRGFQRMEGVLAAPPRFLVPPQFLAPPTQFWAPIFVLVTTIFVFAPHWGEKFSSWCRWPQKDSQKSRNPKRDRGEKGCKVADSRPGARAPGN